MGNGWHYIVKRNDLYTLICIIKIVKPRDMLLDVKEIMVEITDTYVPQLGKPRKDGKRLE